MKIHRDVEQNSLAWMKLRMGKVTASELGNLLTPKFELRTGEMPHTYLCKKVAEAYRGTPLMGFQSYQMEQGQELEDEARGWIAFESGLKVDQVAFIESEDGRSGASPDGLIGEDGGLELKCPEPHTHTKYLLNGSLPAEYACQVHMSMYVTGRSWWKFLSYRRFFPPFIITVDRDEKIIATIGEAISKFSAKYDTALAKLKAL